MADHVGHESEGLFDNSSYGIKYTKSRYRNVNGPANFETHAENQWADLLTNRQSNTK